MSVEEKVGFLGSRAAYRPAPDRVDIIETHMSWIFLTGDFVYKMKKPVHYEFLDFRSLADRKFAAHEEVRLNARLAPGVYLGTVPLRLGERGNLTFGGEGTIVEWLVKMKRLPAGRMLDWLIEHGAPIAEAEVDAVARRLIAFYRAAPRAELSTDEVCEHLAAEHRRDGKVLSDPRFDLDRAQTARALDMMTSALPAVRPLIAARIDGHVFLEGHGDLRPEHICLLDEPVIFDCLEFNRGLRLVDPFDEIAFLDLECERLGAAWIGRRLLASCQRELGPCPSRLIAFYRAARALLRARLALVHLTEPNPRAPEKWEPRARTYISLAASALEHNAPRWNHLGVQFCSRN